MGELVPSLQKLLLLKTLHVEDEGYYYLLAMLLASAAAGGLGLLLDLCLISVGGSSFLRLKHGWITLLWLFTWPLGAAIFSLFAVALHVIEASLVGAITAGIAWNVSMRLIIGSILKSKAEKDADEDEDEGAVQ